MFYSAALAGSKAPMLYVLAAFVAGIISYDLWGIHCSRTLILCCWALLCIMALSAFVLRSRYKWGSYCSNATAFSVITLTAWVLYAYQDTRQSPDWIGARYQNYREFQVRVLDTPREKNATYYIPVSVMAGRDHTGWHTLSGKVRLYVYKNDTVRLQGRGAIYRVPNELQLLKQNHNPFAVDFIRQQQRNGFYHQQFIAPDNIHILSKAFETQTSDQARSVILYALKQYIPDTLTSALAQATLLNEVTDEMSVLKDMYTHTGIMHIIAISGMHVNLLFMLLVLPFYRMRDPRRQWIKYILVLPFVWGYIALCDYPPSAIRAAISFSVITLALCSRRRAEPLQLWAITALTLLCINPAWLYHIGVQLSLLAVLSIILFYRPVRNWFSFSFRPVQLLWETIAMSLAVQVLVAPLIIYYFHQFPVWFLPANVLAAVFSTMLMIMSLVIILFSAIQLPVIALICGKVLVACTQAFHTLLDFLDHYTPDAASWLPLDTWDYVLLMISIIVLAVYFLRRYYPALPAGIGLLLLFVLNLMVQDFMATRQNGIVVYAAGKETLIEHISGRNVRTYSTQTISSSAQEYILRPAHLGYRICQQQAAPLTYGTMNLSAKRIAWADATALHQLAPEMDVLILSGKADPEQIIKLHPAQIILAGGNTRNGIQRLKTQLFTAGYEVYTVAEQGAWIFFE